MPAFPMDTAAEKRRGYLQRNGALKRERSSWDSHWFELSKYILPRSARFFRDDRNKAKAPKFNRIYDNTATRAVGVLRSGIMSNLSPQSAPWFDLVAQDPELRDIHGVRVWLDEVVKRMRRMLERTNLYRVLPLMYEDLGVFGTSAALILPDFETVMRVYPLTIGEYCLQQDWQGQITTVYREFQRTAGEVVKEFGPENCSARVVTAAEKRNHEQPVNILHVIEPRADQDRDFGSKLATDMPWRSVYMELNGETDKLLRESGFNRMRVVAPRWEVRGGDVYGLSPGMKALGDIKQLMHQQLRKSQAIDYQTLPPVVMPQQMRERMQESIPGGRSYAEPGTTLWGDGGATPHTIRSAWEVPLDLSHLVLDIADVRDRIDKALHHDLFLLLAGRHGDMTALEVSERKAEGLTQLGPVVGNLTHELHEKIIELGFFEMADIGALPDPPAEIEGREIVPEFVSNLAVSQRAVGINASQQWMNDAMAISERFPDALDVVNADQWLRDMAEMRGIEAGQIVAEADVQQLRQARAQAQAAEAQAAVMQQQAQTVKTLADAPVGSDSVLDELVASVGGAPGLN